MINRSNERTFLNMPSQDGIVAPDHRVSERTRTVMRIVKVRTSEDEGLARLKNISDGGMMLRVGLPLHLGDTVTIHLADHMTFTAKVVWTEGENCGVRFTDAIDSAALLLEMADRTRDGLRPIRLAADVSAVAYTEAGIHAVRVKDVSQRGMKVRHHASFAEGVAIKILLGSGLERRGVVRWSQGDVAGIQFIEPVSPEQLGSSKLLATDG